MNKEQFKNSLVELINYYVGNMINYQLVAKEAQDNDNVSILAVVEPQIMGLNHGFEHGLDKLIDPLFVGEDADVSEVPGEE
jgi:hypothetical protein